MAALYLDEDIPVALADLLHARGHRAITTRHERHLGSPDPEQLLFAANGGLALVTHNRGDFARLHEAWLTWARGWGASSANRRKSMPICLPISWPGHSGRWPLPT